MRPIDLDVHAHLAPVDGLNAAALPGVEWRVADTALILDGHRVSMADLFFPDRLLAWMNLHQVRRALISIPPPLYRQQLDAHAALDWARYINDGLLAIAAQSGGRLGALLHLPLEHPEVVQRLCETYHSTPAEGVALAAGGNTRIIYSDSGMASLWSWLDSRSSFVFLHPGQCCDGRLTSYYLENLLGNPYETGVAAAHLVMAGVPARYPSIRFCLAHAGGVFPAISGRLERGVVTRRPGIDVAVEPPLKAARRLYADCIAHHPSALRLAQDVFGADHVVFGSDWPFPMGIPEPHSS